MVCGHETVELRSKVWIIGTFTVEVFEKGVLGFVSQGKRTVFALGRALIVVLLEPLWQCVNWTHGGAVAASKEAKLAKPIHL
jgi:hypothetical protein